MNRFLQRIAATALLALAPFAAHASISGGTITITRGGTPAPDLFVIVPTPSELPTLGRGRVDVNDIVFGFDEQVASLTARLRVDDGWIAAGTTVASHYIFFDPRRTQSVEGMIWFDFPILGVISTRSGLRATNDLLGADGVRYGNPRAIGLEPRDLYWVDGNRLSFDWRASDPGDHIRVLTAIPEPGTFAMLLAGLLGLGLIVRRRARG